MGILEICDKETSFLLLISKGRLWFKKSENKVVTSKVRKKRRQMDNMLFCYFENH